MILQYVEFEFLILKYVMQNFGRVIEFLNLIFLFLKEEVGIVIDFISLVYLVFNVNFFFGLFFIVFFVKIKFRFFSDIFFWQRQLCVLILDNGYKRVFLRFVRMVVFF